LPGMAEQKLSLFSDIQTGLALSKWPPISVIFKIRLELEG
jgi:hypothetical protein